MNRRHFLSVLAAAAPVLLLDPERLLWVPGAKNFFLPSLMTSPNTLITPEWITREVAAHFRNTPISFGPPQRWQRYYPVDSRDKA